MGCYVLAFVDETHFGCDALWKEYLWEHGKNHICEERHSGGFEKYGGVWHLASTLVAANG
jgi:hypothetical protein